ncbi:MAG: dihydroorotate dehydrogenase [Chloroflexota bacterium]|nr:MAG: dihydroorotate dehydrogenase [Chloroflexota bacterium]
MTYDRDDIDLHVELAPQHKRGLRLNNPVMVASGTFGYGTEYAKLIDIQRLGAIVSKGVTLRPRRGNAQHRTVETPAGMLNSIGLQNIGVRAVVREKAPIWAQWTVPVIVNVAGETVEQYAAVAERLDGVPGVAGLEINISCPNVSAGGMEFGRDPSSAASVTRAVKDYTDLPVIVKLTPNVGNVVEIAEAVVEAGADALTLINTLLGLSIDICRRRPSLATATGGLSGPAIKPVALRMVYQVARAVRVPLIGCGGIATSGDALEFIMAGATAVQVGTATFSRPQVALEIVSGLRSFLREQRAVSIGEIVGAALPGAPLRRGAGGSPEQTSTR